MLRNRKFLKAVAVFFVLEITANAIFPSVSWALTSGPTAPEATSFEPVDTTDMVSLVNGDLAYNIPLIDVPGPSGGYPLSLSYHGGIQTDQDASWVGLGWALNPGAINRSVNGYADDHQNVTGTDRSFWEGGTSRSLTVGLNVGYGGTASVSAGLVFADDTYKGSGVGYYYGVSTSESYGIMNAGVSHMRGVSPYGESYSSTGVSVGIGAGTQNGLSAGVSAGVTFDQDGKATGSLNGNASLSGISISTNHKGDASVSVGGFTKSVHNSRAGKVSTKGYNYSGNIPVYWGVSVKLGKSYQRYWIDETENVSISGSLYFPILSPSSESLDTKSYDIYDIQNPLVPLTDSPDERPDGSFVDYDSYVVLGQGIGGSIRPYHHKSYGLRQNKIVNGKARVKSYPLWPNVQPTFRFVGDFSNRYEHDATQDQFESNTINPLSFIFHDNKTTGENGNDGYNLANNRLAGSRHVEYFTNAEIKDATRVDNEGYPVPPTERSAINRGFLDCKALGFARTDDAAIGGFKITNESGVTYHYALPVLSGNEYQYSGRVDEANKHQFNTYAKSANYAYTWLLTAVTGADFVDTNNNGFADSADWGYWVTFEYGKWTNRYEWRNPSGGFNKDIDQSFNTFSKGRKQIYYLNSITTKTHTAVFVKEIREDGKGVVPLYTEAINPGDKSVNGVDPGGYAPREKPNPSSGTYTEYPVSTLKLKYIYLFQNKDLEQIGDVSSIAAMGNTYYHSLGLHWDIGKYTHGQNVIDIYDFDQPSPSELSGKCLKKIELKTDYSLCPNTPNSFRSALDVLNTGQTVTTTSGKLTLNSLKIFGRGGADLLPETKFKYELEESFYATLDNAEPSPSRILKVQDFAAADLKTGDLFYYRSGNVWVYGYVTEVRPATEEIAVRFNHGNTYFSYNGALLKFNKTKNPPYHSEAQDMWGLYKSDFTTQASGSMIDSENVRRMTTTISSPSRDAWSLREINTVLGSKIKIEYESDEYQNTLKSLSNIPIKSIEKTADNKTKIELFEDVAEYGLAPGKAINMRFVTAIRYDVHDPGFFEGRRFDCNGGQTYVYKWYFDRDRELSNNPATILSVNGQSCVVDYNFTNRYPIGDNASCLEEAYPYKEESFSQANDGSLIKIKDLIQSQPIFIGGEIISNNIISSHGGDLRVKKVSLENGDQTRSTLYEYFNGVTSYEPLGFAIPLKKLPGNLYQCLRDIEKTTFDSYRQAYFDQVFQRFRILFANTRELPPPGVMYEWVRVKEQIERPDGITQLDGKVEYQFEVFSPKNLDISIPGGGSTNNPIYGELNKIINYVSPQHRNDPTQPILGLPVVSISSSNGNNITRIKDYTAFVGNLKRIVMYDKNGFKISQTENHYLHDNFNETNFASGLLSKYKNQGVLTESTADARIIIRNKVNPSDADSYALYGVLSQKTKYPSIQTGQTTTNFRTGIKNNSQNLSFDFYSGEVTSVQTEDGYGNKFITESIPAYRKYPGMGLAYTGSKNMLVQSAGSTTYRINKDNGKALLRAEVQTWSTGIPLLDHEGKMVTGIESFNLWRKHRSYSWTGDNQIYDATAHYELYPFASFAPFDFTSQASNATQWQRQNEIKLSNVYSKVLEITDINGNYAATKMSADQMYVFASAANAGYNDFAYSGAEDNPIAGIFGGNVKADEGTRVNNPANAHTGGSSLFLASSKKGFTYETLKSNLKNQGPYHASVWVKSISGEVPNVALVAETNGGSVLSMASPVVTHRSGNWFQINLDFELPASSALVKVYVKNNSPTDYFVDDYRLHPLNASMNSFVYTAFGELSHILDNNNMYTEYRYDKIGRLKETYKETFLHDQVKTSEVIYHYRKSVN